MPEPDPNILSISLARALALRLRDEARNLAPGIRPSRLEQAAWHLLGLPGEASGDGALPDEALIPSRRPTGEDSEPQDYLHLVPEEMRRSLGQHVTPRPIVRHILRASGYRESPAILETRLCDPACGSGIFLVEAVRILLRTLQKTGLPAKEWYPRLRAHFAGVDIDLLACFYARFNLALLLSPAILAWLQAHPRRLPEDLPIYHRDTLAALAGQLGGNGLLAGSEPGPELRESFDFVVGNPPYRKLGSLPPPLQEAFRLSIYGHPNAYGLFLHAGLEMLRPGGALGFIVPRSMLSGLYFQNLRRLIEERARLEELTLLADRKKVFPEVLQATMILVFRKPLDAAEPRDGGSLPVRTAIVRAVADLEDAGPVHVLPATRQITRRLNGTTIWFVSDQERTYSILDKLLGRYPLLGGAAIACPAKTGPIVWNRVKPALRTRRDAGSLPLIWATDVGRFRFAFGSAADVRPAYLEETPQTRGLATLGTSVLVQRVTADEQARRIVASVAPFSSRQRYFVENHLNVLQPFGPSQIDLRYLLGILSSDVVEFLFRSMNGNTQVSATELNLLPIPRGTFEAEIAGLTAALEEADRGEERMVLEAELQERTARAYGLSVGELAFIQRILRSNPAASEGRREA
jgi:adenine-specific DNA-methyltransferase